MIKLINLILIIFFSLQLHSKSCADLLFNYENDIKDLELLVENFGFKQSKNLVTKLMNSKNSQGYKSFIWDQYLRILKDHGKVFVSTRYSIDSPKGKIIFYFGGESIPNHRNQLIILPSGFIYFSTINIEIMTQLKPIRHAHLRNYGLRNHDGNNDHILNLEFQPTIMEREEIDAAIRKVYPSFFEANNF